MNARKQAGLGLVEIMLAVLISSFLLIGITEIFAGNKRTYNYQQVQGMANENQRLASVLLTNLIHQIGYAPITQESVMGKHKVFADATVSKTKFEAGETVSGTTQTVGTFIQDTITYRYFSGQEIMTCAGQPFPLSQVGAGVLEFKQRTETLSIDANGHLVCTGVTQIGSTISPDETVVLLGDAFVSPSKRIIVQEMIITYGIDADDDNSVDVYATADDVGDLTIVPNPALDFESPWHRVKTIKLELTIQSGTRSPQRTEYVVHLENLTGTEV